MASEVIVDSEATEVSARAWAILAAMGLGALIAQMFSTVIGPALPTIKADLDLSLSEQTWTITAYSLAFGTALVAGGRLGDLVGEVKMIVSGLGIFAVGLVMAAMANDGGLLIAGRTIQGIGIGISAPATLSIVVNSFPIARRGFAVGVWGFAHGAGLLVGPLFAGYMLEFASWQWVFWVAVPLTVVVIIVTLLATKGYKSVLAKGSYDWLGLIVGGAGITLLTFGLQNSSSGWTSPATWGTLIAGVVLLAVFAFIEMRIEFPLVDFGLWKERLFSGGFFAESAVGFVYIPMLTFVGALYFINVLGFSPVKAGYVILWTTLTCMLLEPGAGWVVDRIGPGIPITFSLALQAAGLFLMGTFSPTTSGIHLIAPLVMMGAGVGIALPACNTAGMSAVDAKRAGMGSGLMQMTFNIPAALGVALVTSVIGTLTLSKVQSAAPNPGVVDSATKYATAVQDGNDTLADQILSALPLDIANAIKDATVGAQASAITISMVVLGFVALAGAIFAWFCIGRRRTPDHVEVMATHQPAC